MPNFLDETGLSLLWNKTVDKFIKKSGDTMTGGLVAQSFGLKSGNNYPQLQFYSADGQYLTGKIQQTVTTGDRRIGFQEYNADQDGTATPYREQYLLPAPNAGLTANKTYSILTSKDPITIAQGGTGAATRVDAANNLLKIGTDPVTSTANDTVAKWAELGNGFAWYDTSGYLIDQPSAYGTLLNLNAIGSEVSQLWFTAPSGAVYHRGANASGWNGTWIRFYDTVNKPTPEEIGAVPLSGAVMQGTLTLAETDGLKTPHTDGWKTDNYGSFIHTSTNTSNYWCIKSSASSPIFKVWYESGNVDVSGTLTATKVIGAVYA